MRTKIASEEDRVPGLHLTAGHGRDDPDPIQSAVASPRDAVIDVAKGIGIVLVVIGHAWRGLEKAGIIGDAALFLAVDKIIYNFHMPLFFVLAGMTFERSARDRPWTGFVASRVTRLLWPLVLWTYLFSVAKLLAGDSANTPLDGVGDLLFWPLPPQYHFWFLWALLVLQLFFFMVLRLAVRPVRPGVWLALSAAFLVASSFQLLPRNDYTVPAIQYASAFLAGLWLAGQFWRPAGPAAAVAGTAAFVALQVLSFVLPPSLLLDQLLGVLLALAVLAIVAAVLKHPLNTMWRFMAYLGVSSMGIFLAHTIFSAAARVALQQTGSGVALHMVAGVIAGILGPLLIYFFIRRIGRPSWIGF